MTRPKRSRSKVDEQVGIRIRERRIMLGLSQEELAEMIGVCPQQVGRYECGGNIMSAGRLYEIARELDTPVASFYEGFSDELPHQPLLHERTLLDIARHFGEIENETHRQALRELTRILAAR
jgi:transcriptional regulator with XRE-family HTH domain